MSPATTHRDRILDAAQALVLSKGYPATRVDEICADAGVTKGSFYHHFESKDGLAAALIEHYFGTIRDALSAEPWAVHEDPKDRVLAFLDAFVDVMKGPMLKRGCLLGSMALDLSETHPALRVMIDERLKELACIIENDLRAALKHAPKRRGISAPKLAQQFVAVLQGAIVLAKASADHAVLASSMACHRELVRAVLEDA